MASDFGDESGEKLFDWFLRMGQDMSEEALRASAERLKGAIQNLRGNLEDAAPQQDEEVREFARLDMSEFEELPDYESLKAIIGERLDDAAIEHDFAKVDGLEQDVDAELERACEAREIELTEARDQEPLEDKAKAAREASKAAHEAKDAAREVERVEVKSR